jgi:hypothetical protein
VKVYQGGSMRLLANGRRAVESHMWLVSGVDFGAAVDAIAGALQGSRVQVSAHPLSASDGEVLLIEASPFTARDADAFAEAVETIGGLLGQLVAGKKPKRAAGSKQLPIFGNPRRLNPSYFLGSKVEPVKGGFIGRAYFVVPLPAGDAARDNASDALVAKLGEVAPAPGGGLGITTLWARGGGPSVALVEAAVGTGQGGERGRFALEMVVGAWQSRIAEALDLRRSNPAKRKGGPKALAAAKEDFTTFHWGDKPDKTMKVATKDLALVGPLVVLGELAEVAYDTSKAGDSARWVHEFGDGEAGLGTAKPLLVVDRAGRLGIIGGSYDVRDVGIVG